MSCDPCLGPAAKRAMFHPNSERAQVEAGGFTDEHARRYLSRRMPLRTSRFRSRGPPRTGERMQLLDLHEKGISPLDSAAEELPAADAYGKCLYLHLQHRRLEASFLPQLRRRGVLHTAL